MTNATVSEGRNDHWLVARRDAQTGIESLRAHFSGHAYDPHDHDDMLIGYTEQGVQPRGRLALSAQRGLSPLQPLAIVFAGMARPVFRVVHDLGVKLTRALAVGVAGLLRQPVGEQATRCGVAGARERGFERGTRAGRAIRGQGPCIQQGWIGLLAGDRLHGEELLQRFLRGRGIAVGELRTRQPLEQGRIGCERPAGRRLVTGATRAGK